MIFTCEQFIFIYFTMKDNIGQTDNLIDTVSNFLKGFIGYITAMEPQILLTIVVGVFLVFFGVKLVKSIIGLFFYGAFVTVGIIALEYIQKYPKK
jgi:hypothetical protein